mmetsp:Transcript_134716/g.430392  ORF Transcript_134716/g.430392 Transcript_134716/m.430392 type:complete len:129 (-) Transcript_134716:726-1112(-)
MGGFYVGPGLVARTGGNLALGRCKAKTLVALVAGCTLRLRSAVVASAPGNVQGAIARWSEKGTPQPESPMQVELLIMQKSLQVPLWVGCGRGVEVQVRSSVDPTLNRLCVPSLIGCGGNHTGRCTGCS